MKCDELKVRPYTILPSGQCYDRDEVDEAIAELKDKIKFCSDFELAARKDIQEMRGQHQMLKQFGHYQLSPVPGKMINHEVRQYVSYNVVCMIINQLESENADLKQKLENVQASAYADSVDAGMRDRRLKRALWLARAERADDRARIFYFSDLESVLDIDGFSYDSKKKKGCKKLTARLWRIIWLNVERKCRDKAEEYR